MKRRRRIIKIRRAATGLSLVASISFIAGMTDAVGLMLTGNFVSFMTGNTTRAAIAIGTGDTSRSVMLLATILLFVAGNALGIIVAHRTERRAFAVLSCSGILLAAASLFSTANALYLQLYLVVVAMGMINAAVEHIEGLPIGLTYVTGALSRFGRGIGRYLLGDRDLAWRIQIVPWLGMIAGACLGAMLTDRVGAQALFIVSLICFAAAIASVFIPRPLRRRFSQSLSSAGTASRQTR